MMRSCVRAILAAFVVTLVVTRPAAAQTPVADTLPSTFMVGALRVVHQQRSTSETVAIELFLLGGARQINDRNAGIEPLVLHASAFGSKRYPGAAQAGALASTGSAVHVETDNDWTAFSLRTLRSELDSAWTVFGDRVVSPSLLDRDVLDARRQMVADVAVASTNPDYLLMQVARPIAFAGHAYANDPGGTDRSLRTIRPEQVREFHRTQFVASRMLLVVVGNVDRATVERLVGPFASALPAGAYTWTPPPAIPLRKTSITIVPRKLPTDYVIGIFPGPLAGSREQGAFRLGTGLLGGLLSYEIRQERQLSYAANAPLFDHLAMAGGFYASTIEPARVIQIMIDAIERVGNNTLPLGALPRFVSQFEIDDLLSRATNAGQARQLARKFLVQGNLDGMGSEFRALRAVNAENLRRVVARYVPAIHFVFIGDPSRVQQFIR